jgi:hypothetical protein
VRVYLPRLLNLKKLWAGSTCSFDGVQLRPSRHRVYRRFETLDFKVGTSTPKIFGISTAEGAVFTVPINAATPNDFRNRRVLYTLLKDEKIEWIQDWLQFHNQIQGADAVLIANNGSTSYTSSQLLEAIEEVPGYVSARVLYVPLPWGPRGNAPGVDDGKYLQTTLLNLTRDRFFSAAHGVLNLDVDELLLRRGKSSVFDSIKRWGFMTFPGEWRYPSDVTGEIRHQHHRFRDGNDKPCATKYCFSPSSLLGKMCLSVHGLERLNRKLFSGSHDFLFLHCRNISTSWKHDRAKAANSAMVLDNETVAALDAVYQPSLSNG